MKKNTLFVSLATSLLLTSCAPTVTQLSSDTEMMVGDRQADSSNDTDKIGVADGAFSSTGNNRGYGNRNDNSTHPASSVAEGRDAEGVNRAVVVYSDKLIPIPSPHDEHATPRSSETRKRHTLHLSSIGIGGELRGRSAISKKPDNRKGDSHPPPLSRRSYAKLYNFFSSSETTSLNLQRSHTVPATQNDVHTASTTDDPVDPDAPHPAASSESAQTEETEGIFCDFPVVMNKEVDFYLKQFQKKQRRNFKRWLERSAVYLPVIQEELKKAALPLSLAYLAMIESGFNPSAYSKARAAGLWQFIRSTGHNYGLRIDSWVDERRDPVKATKAAASYLKALYERFGDWQLAVAAYNAGEGKIERGLKKYNAQDFWELARHEYLSPETKRYVPKLIAAIILASDPEKYGFTDLEYKEPLEYDLLEVPSRSHLKRIAACGSLSVDEIRQLNNELLKNEVPPSKGGYTIKVPAGMHKRIAAQLQQAGPGTDKHPVRHKLRKGETLSGIGQRYGVPVSMLMQWNNITDARKIQVGRHLKIYLNKDKENLAEDEKRSTGDKVTLSYYKVRNGDSLWSIARKHEVSMREIKQWNSLEDNRLHPGKELVIRKS